MIFFFSTTLSLIALRKSLILVNFIFITGLGMRKIRGMSGICRIRDDCRDGDISSSDLIMYTLFSSHSTQNLLDGFVDQIHANILKSASKAQSTRNEPLLTSMSLPRQDHHPNTSYFLSFEHLQIASSRGSLESLLVI